MYCRSRNANSSKCRVAPPKYISMPGILSCKLLDLNLSRLSSCFSHNFAVILLLQQENRKIYLPTFKLHPPFSLFYLITPANTAPVRQLTPLSQREPTADVIDSECHSHPHQMQAASGHSFNWLCGT